MIEDDDIRVGGKQYRILQAPVGVPLRLCDPVDFVAAVLSVLLMLIATRVFGSKRWKVGAYRAKPQFGMQLVWLRYARTVEEAAELEIQVRESILRGELSQAEKLTRTQRQQARSR